VRWAPWLLLLAPACSDAAAPTPPDDDTTATRDVPPGTVMVLSGVPITAEEIDRHADWIGLVHPETSRAHLRRKALIDQVLPRAAVRAAHPAARAAARASAEVVPPLSKEGLSVGDGVSSGTETAHDWPPGGGVVGRATGTWKDLGYAIWGTARELEPGSWSGILEETGRFVRVRLDEEAPDEPPYRQQLTVTVAVFEYRLDVPLDRQGIAAAVDAAQLEILDPSWSETIPEAWRTTVRGARHAEFDAVFAEDSD